ncbi:MAG: hypothetical protein WCF85_19865 [Rhodospirillaceae bacterium]
MSHAHKFAGKDATAASLTLIAVKLETMDQRQQAAEANVRSELGELRSLLHKILDGQAVLHQNDMELKRRLDQKT